VDQPDADRFQEQDRHAGLVGRELKIEVGRRPRLNDEVAEVIVVDPPVGGLLCNPAGVPLAFKVVWRRRAPSTLNPTIPACEVAVRANALSTTLRSTKDGPSSPAPANKDK
jgi:hypothetical protein